MPPIPAQTIVAFRHGRFAACRLGDVNAQQARRKAEQPKVAGDWGPANLRIHDLRHSFASALANAGTPL